MYKFKTHKITGEGTTREIEIRAKVKFTSGKNFSTVINLDTNVLSKKAHLEHSILLGLSTPFCTKMNMKPRVIESIKEGLEVKMTINRKIVHVPGVPLNYLLEDSIEAVMATAMEDFLEETPESWSMFKEKVESESAGAEGA